MHLDEAVRYIQQRWANVVSTATDEPVFVLGAGWRSGSTLLQRMLLRHCLVWGEPFGSSGLLERLSQPLQRFALNWPPDDWFLNHPHWGERLGEKWTANLYPPFQYFLDAYVAFFQKLLAEPSRQRGYARWGLKEVRYGIEHALFFQWLFPRAKFLFLLRNPYDCWASFRRIQARVIRFWPETLITAPEQFGAHWVSLADHFSHRYPEVGGRLIRYESLQDARFDLKPLEDYVGFSLDRAAQAKRVGASPSGMVSADEMARLRQVVEPLAGRLGYGSPEADVVSLT